jgi:hypothetical protein
MPTYFVYLHDPNSKVPTLEAITVSNDARVRELVARRLDASPHYVSADIWDDERLVGKVERAADPTPA